MREMASLPIAGVTDGSATALWQAEPGPGQNGSMTREMSAAFQDRYPEDVAHCYGCGRLNSHGHRLKTHWDGDETVTRFTPQPYHTAIPGYVYGGLIASLIDCHGTGTAAAAAAEVAGPEAGHEGQPGDLLPRFVTASLHVDYLRPTPLGPEIEIRGRAREVTGRKVVVEARVLVNGQMTARGTVVAVRMPEGMAAGTADAGFRAAGGGPAGSSTESG
jgi:acyl-coenzyme A thioesterase PaaI-like protein